MALNRTPRNASGIRNKMMMALKMMAERMAECGLCRCRMSIFERPGKMLKNIAGMITKYFATSFVIENQCGRADHDHLTRGLAYAVAPPRARGLVVIAEQHRDEFRAVAEYLNDLADILVVRKLS